MRDLSIRWRFEVNLLAVARQGERLRKRLQQVRFEVGDVLLLQGTPGTLQEAMKALGCLPLAERGLKIGEPQRIILAVGIFGFAIAIAAVGLVPIQVIFRIAAALIASSLA